jgi:hypothetical protein
MTSDRISSFITAMLCNGYGLRIGIYGEFEDFVGDSEEVVKDAIDEAMASDMVLVSVFPDEDVKTETFRNNICTIMLTGYEEHPFADWMPAEPEDDFIRLRLEEASA